MEPANIHANCVMLAKSAPVPFGMHFMGVLILGDSGSGKSDLTLRLIEQGAILVCDDRTELFVEDGKLKARPPAALAGLLEVRGAGIMALPHEKSAEIALVVQLTDEEIPRLPQPAFYTPPLTLPQGVRLPLLKLNAREISATAKLRWAAYAFSQNLFREQGNG